MTKQLRVRSAFQMLFSAFMIVSLSSAAFAVDRDDNRAERRAELTNAANAKKDDKLLSDFLKIANKGSGEKVKSELSLKEISELYTKTLENPVSTLDIVDQYDPTGIIGFCFGRAMSAHLTARQGFNVDPKSIYKLFVVGDLRSNPEAGEWRFHVTTVVPAKADGKTVWYAIDPIMEKPLTVAQWMTEVRAGWDEWQPKRKDTEDPKKKLPHQARFFLVNASAVLPDIRIFPDPEVGKHLIELSFDTSENGIRANSKWAEAFGTTDTVYSLSSSKTEEFFLVTKAEVDTRFSFVGLKVNADYIPYNGNMPNSYFEDLLATFNTPRPPELRIASRSMERKLFERPAVRSLGFQLHRLKELSGAGK